MGTSKWPAMRTVANDPVGVGQFSVVVDGLSLGTFTSCEGLQVEFTFEEVMEGGNNAYVYRLPGRIKYQNVKLTRPLSRESTKIPIWLDTFAKKGHKRGLATIRAIGTDPSQPAVCVWVLKEVHPVRWTGPTFSADTSGVAKETLEIAYHGFDWDPKAFEPE
jgi:phage tail-like protein